MLHLDFLILITTKLAKINGFIAIFLDNQLIMSQRVNEAITGGEIMIDGNRTAEEAGNLVNIINIGALPFKLSYSELIIK